MSKSSSAMTHFSPPATYSGPKRSLILAGGEQKIFSHAEVFSRPLSEGLKSVFAGHFGLAGRHTLMVLALPGLVLLGRKRCAERAREALDRPRA